MHNDLKQQNFKEHWQLDCFPNNQRAVHNWKESQKLLQLCMHSQQAAWHFSEIICIVCTNQLHLSTRLKTKIKLLIWQRHNPHCSQSAANNAKLHSVIVDLLCCHATQKHFAISMEFKQANSTDIKDNICIAMHNYNCLGIGIVLLTECWLHNINGCIAHQILKWCKHHKFCVKMQTLAWVNSKNLNH